MKIILASGSPRRREILENLGLKFEISVADADERSDELDPCKRVMALAAIKGRATLENLRGNGADKLREGDALHDTLIIACDTLVYAHGEFLGKPRDEADAKRMLLSLSDSEHEVISGIYLYLNGKEITRAASTAVVFDRMSEEDVDRYVEGGEPMDKAGAYAVQGKAAAYIRGIRGDYFNVVGLPVNLLRNTLRECFGVDITAPL